MRTSSRRPSPRPGRRLLALLGAFALILLGITAAAGSAQAATTITNGDFEAGNLSGWTTAGAASATTSGPHAGTYAAQVGSTSPTNGDSSIAQSFTAPSGGGTLSFWYNVTCPDTVTYDWATATLADTTAGTTTTVLAKTCVASSGWKQVSANVVSGHNYTLTLVSHDDNYAGDATYTNYDDVNLAAAPPPSTGITNGTFETGSLTGWTAAGTTSATTSGPHSGTYAAQLGSTSPTNGDSSIAQTFTAPTGATQLSFWYNVTCPDTVTYDWATATLLDQTTGTSTTPLAKTCVASSGWQQVTAAVTAGHNYTLTLVSHDDNYSGDATYTKYDDVTTNSASPDFSLAASPSSGSVTVGGSTTTTISVTGTGGFSGAVTLGPVSGLPAGTTATFNPSSVTPGGTSTLTLATSSATPTGTYNLTITGTSGTLSHTVPYTLAVNPVVSNDFTISDSPASGSVTQGSSTTTTVSTAVASGTAQTVTLSASGLPAGATAAFNPASVTAGAGSTLTLATASNTPTGTYTVTITGAYPGGAPSHTATFSLTVNPAGGGGLVQVSSDPFTDTDAQHATEVEPDTYAYGSTIVAAFQVGRVYGGGASDLGWATSTDAGVTWQHGFLSGITVNQGGSYAQVSDATVVYNAKFNAWLIVGLPIDSSGNALGLTVNRSTDGGLTWGSATHAVGFDGAGYDKQWVTCDNTSTSPYYGNCYIEADITSSGNAEFMSTSTDGGVTWGAKKQPSGSPAGLGGQPVVQPNGTVVVPFSTNGSSIEAFTSTNGGSTWGSVNTVAGVSAHAVAGGLRDGEGLPSAEIDGAGKVYVAWQDCRFRSGCPGNDIVMATSTNGTSWSAVTRIPIDATTSGADHFIPGIGVDHATSGGTAKLGVYYYFYPNANCTTSSCQMSVGFTSSADGGTTWSPAQTVAGPMTMAQIANTSQGYMVGDYISASVVNGKSIALFAVGKNPTNGKAFDEAMYAPAGGLLMAGGPVRATTGPVFAAPVQTRTGGHRFLM